MSTTKHTPGLIAEMGKCISRIEDNRQLVANRILAGAGAMDCIVEMQQDIQKLKRIRTALSKATGDL